MLKEFNKLAIEEVDKVRKEKGNGKDLFYKVS